MVVTQAITYRNVIDAGGRGVHTKDITRQKFIRREGAAAFTRFDWPRNRQAARENQYIFQKFSMASTALLMMFNMHGFRMREEA